MDANSIGLDKIILIGLHEILIIVKSIGAVCLIIILIHIIYE